MDNLNDRLIKSQIVRSLNMIESGGGGEVWEDITSIFSVNSTDEYYNLTKSNIGELVENKSLRITIETFVFGASGNSVRGTTQLYGTPTATATGRSFLLQTNTIYLSDSLTFSGRLFVRVGQISYEYGIAIPEASERPKILKVERLLGV